MAESVSVPEQLRPNVKGARPNGRRQSNGHLHEPGDGHMVHSEADSFGLHDNPGPRDWLAMVVRKATQRVKESSAAEKLIAGILAIGVALIAYGNTKLNHLDREVGEAITLQKAHRENHPNVAIEQDIDSLEGRVRDLEIDRARPRPPL